MDDGFGAFQSALGGFNGVARDGAGAVLVGFEFHEAGRNDLSQMALFVPLGYFDGFVNATVPKSAGYCRGECA